MRVESWTEAVEGGRPMSWRKEGVDDIVIVVLGGSIVRNGVIRVRNKDSFGVCWA